MQHRDFIVLKKIVTEMKIGVQLVSDIDKDAFLGDELRKRAGAMTTINVGELVKTLTDELRVEYSYVPWRGMAGLRDIAAHRYQTLRMEDIYITITEEFPVLIKKIEEIIESEENKEN